jgi:hypothetical protein
VGKITMANMKDLSMQMSLPLGEGDLEGNIFELYTKNPNREFQSHVRFVRAASREAAEDYVSESDPNYWKTMSVRSVRAEYIWKTFESLHMSYHTCKSILGLEGLDDS